MKYVIFAFITALSWCATGQSVFTDARYSNLVGYGFEYNQVLKLDSKTLGYCSYAKQTSPNTYTAFGRFYSLDQNLDETKEGSQSFRILEPFGDLLTMNANVYQLFSGQYKMNSSKCYALKFDPISLTYADSKIDIFINDKYDIFVKSPNEKFVCFFTGSNLRMFDENMNLLWISRMESSVKLKTNKNIAVSNSGDLYVLARVEPSSESKTELISNNYVVEKITKETTTKSAFINYNNTAILSDVTFMIDKQQKIRVLGYGGFSESTTSTQGVFQAIVDPDNLSFSTDFIDITGKVASYSVKSKKNQTYTDNLLKTYVFQPLLLDDGSYYLVAEIRNLEEREGQYGTIYTSFFTSDGKHKWTKYIVKDQEETNIFPFIGVVPLVVEDKLHLLYNEFTTNENLSEDEPRDIVNSISKELVVFDNEIDTNGELILHTPKFPNFDVKRINLNTPACHTSPNKNIKNYLVLNVQSGMAFKSVFVSYN